MIKPLHFSYFISLYELQHLSQRGLGPVADLMHQQMLSYTSTRVFWHTHYR